MSNIITIAGENSKKRKGDGVNAVLTLMKEMRDFQDKVEVCIEAQDISQNRKKLEIFYDKLDEMAEVMLDIAESGIKSKRRMMGIEEEVETVDEERAEDLEEEVELEDETSAIEEVSVNKTPRIQMVNAPSIPKLPR